MATTTAASNNNNNTLQQAIASLQEKITNPDADYRYMALNDLTQALLLVQGDWSADQRTEQNLLNALFKLLADTNSAVKNMAVKCLPPLVLKLSATAVRDLVNQLNTQLTNARDESVRDVMLMALTATFKQVHPTSYPDAADLAMGSINALMLALPNEPSDTIKSDLLDASAELLAQYTPSIVKHVQCQKFVNSLQPTLLSLVQMGQAPIRKRAGVSLTHLLLLLSTEECKQVVDILVTNLDKLASSNPETLRTHLVTLSLMIKQNLVTGLVPNLISAFCAVLHYSTDFDEVREAGLQALDSLLVRYSTECTPSVPELTNLALKLIQYDPNYTHDLDTFEHATSDVIDPILNLMDTCDSDSDDYAYSDDEDMSWKVRRASARMLASILITFPDMTIHVMHQVHSILTQQFQEREETVRTEILSTYTTLLQTTTSTTALTLLKTFRPTFHCRFIKYIANAKELATQTLGFTILTYALDVFDWTQTSTQVAPVWAALVSRALTHTGHTPPTSCTALQLNALQFTHRWLSSRHTNLTSKVSSILASALVVGMTNTYYKVCIESMHVSCLLVPMLVNHALKDQVHSIHNHVESILLNPATDPDLKDSALILFGHILSHMLPSTGWLDVLMSRLANESARVLATKVITTILNSQVIHTHINLFITRVMPELTTNLRKNMVGLRDATLLALTTVFEKFPTLIHTQQVQSILEDLPTFVSVDNLGQAALVIKLASLILEKFPNQLPLAITPESSTTRAGIVHTATNLLQSAQVSGTLAMTSLLSLIESSCQASKSLGEFPSRSMYTHLCSIEPVQPTMHAKALAVAANFGGLDPFPLVANELVPLALHTGKPPQHRQLALLTIGEFGQFWPIVADHEQLLPAIVSLFDSDQDSVRASAAITLGSLAIGNPGVYLPDIVAGIRATGAHRALMLLALKQVLTSTVPDLSHVVPQLWADLFTLVASSTLTTSTNIEEEGLVGIMEEGARLAIAECIGKLALLNPAQFVLDLHTKLQSKLAEVRVTVMGAVKYILAHGTKQIDLIIKPVLSDFVKCIGDPDLQVRRASLAAIQTAVHARPTLIQPLMDQVMPLVIIESQVRPELVREVIMGPFKHKIDDGLETRKLAYETMSTVLTTLANSIRPGDLLTPILLGLNDAHQEVKLLAYFALAKLTHFAHVCFQFRLDEFVDPFKAAIFPRIKQDAIKHDVDKQTELVRAAMHTLVSITNDVDQQVLAINAPKFVLFFNEVKCSPVTASELVAAQVAVKGAKH